MDVEISDEVNEQNFPDEGNELIISNEVNEQTGSNTEALAWQEAVELEQQKRLLAQQQRLSKLCVSPPQHSNKGSLQL